MKGVRIVLDESVTKDNVNSLAWDLGWSLGDVIKAEGTTPRQTIFYEEEEDGSITYIRYTDDTNIDLPYMEVYGEDRELIDLIAEDIHKSLNTHSLPEVVEMVKRAKTKDDREELFLAMRYLGIACGGQPTTPELLKLFYDLAYDPDPDISHTATIAMGYTAWAEFKEPLEYLAQNHPTQSRREYAAHILWALKKNVLQELA